MPRPAPSRRLWAGAALAAAVVVGSTACGQEAADEPTPAPPAAVPSASAPSVSAPSTAAPPTSAPPTSPPSPSAPPTSAPNSIDIRPAVPEPAVAVPQPVRIQVEGTEIDLEVVPAGVEPNGAMALPDNHEQAAWYRYGPAPGAAEGSSVLAAHVDSRTEQLPIAGLKDVPAGTVVAVTREDGSVLRYATESVENIAKKSLDGHRLFDRTGEPRLKLVTCGGQWLEAQDDYEDNVVLTAAPVS